MGLEIDMQNKQWIRIHCESELHLPNNDWIDNNIVLTSYRALHFSLSMSKQMLPCASTFGWKHGVVKRTLGAEIGYPDGNSSRNLYLRPV